MVQSFSNNKAMQNALAQRKASHPDLALPSPPPVVEKTPRMRRLTKVSVPSAEVKRTRLMSVDLDLEVLANILRAHYPGITSDMTLSLAPIIGEQKKLNIQWEEE